MTQHTHLTYVDGCFRCDLNKDEEEPLTKLTPRQKQIVIELAKGLSNRDIAQTVGLTYDGVAFHLRTLYRRFGVKSRTQLLVKLSKQGIIDTELIC